MCKYKRLHQKKSFFLLPNVQTICRLKMFKMDHHTKGKCRVNPRHHTPQGKHLQSLKHDGAIAWKRFPPERSVLREIHCRVNPRDWPPNGPVMWRFGFTFVVSPNKLFNNHPEFPVILNAASLTRHHCNQHPCWDFFSWECKSDMEEVHSN